MRPRNQRSRSWLLRLELLLLAGGAVCISVYLYQWLERTQAQGRFEQELYEPAPQRPGAGDVLGRIEIPGAGVSAIVVEGVDEAVLRTAVGHVPTTALPGESGRIALAGHRDTFFRGLRNAKPGDLVRLTTPADVYDYRIVSAQVVEPDRVDVIAPTAEPALALITCHPFTYTGNAPFRYVVHARPAQSDLSPDTGRVSAKDPSRRRRARTPGADGG
ncbi:MAG: class D sortase [Bryobacteraceae bacterium]